MFSKNRISMYDLVCVISEIVDMVSPALNSHHKKVARVASNIALEMNLPNEDIQNIIIASMLHDIGVSLAPHVTYENGINQYALMGYNLLKNFEPFIKAAELIKYYHTDFDLSGNDRPIGSYIIHLADKTAALFDEHRKIAGLPLAADKFHPEVFTAFTRLIDPEYVWVEIREIQFSKEIIDLETLQNFAEVIAQIIDFRSRFTATHSNGVAAVARELAVISGFSQKECKRMEIAGLLHDLGKLAIPNDILKRYGRLSDEEFNTIRRHTYYTYIALSNVSGLESIATWAAYRHRGQDGNEYPFHIKRYLSRLSRIMAVADILTTLTEDKPYWTGMNKEKTVRILFDMAENGGLDKSTVDLAKKYFFRINDARIKAQQEAQKHLLASAAFNS